MQQERERGVEEVRQNQDRRLKTMQMENQQHQQQQPQKCPRCDSLNTKFCYYNNYSLSQPRYFCKTCRRYWTQGGTLRNVPVGGGCRKGKRTKTSSSGENSSSHPLPQQPQQTHQNLTSSAVISTTNEPTNLASPAIQSISSLYPGGGFLSSLAAIQSLNQPQAFNQNLSVRTDLGASSNLGLLQGFNVPSFGSQQHQQIQQTQFYQMENRDKNSETLYPSEEGLIQSSRVPSSQHDWHQSFGNNSNIPTVSHAILWSTNGSTTTSTAGNNNRNAAGSSLNPYQWLDLPGYGPTP